MSEVAAGAILSAEERPGSIQFSLAAIATSLFAASVIPDGPPGIGFPLAAITVGAAVIAARPQPHSFDFTVFGGLSVLLISIAALRADLFLVVFSILAAAALAIISIGGAQSWLKVFLAWLAPLLRLHLIPGFLLRPFTDRIAGGAMASFAPVVRGVLFAAILLLTFGTLFASADAAFAHFTQELIPDIDLGLLPARIVIFFVILVFTSALAIIGPRFASTGPSLDVDFREAQSPRGMKRIEWTIALVSLDLLFLAFVALQLTVLFGGNAYVLQTAGLTYSEYAREGFFQLLVVGALTLAVVAGAVRWAERDSTDDARLLKLLLGILCGLVLVVLLSALHRLGLYEQAFGFTRARLIGHTVTLWLGGIFLLVIVAGAFRISDWLPRASIALTGFALLAFGLINPDATVARHNIERYAYTGEIDLHYLGSLSLDAVPEMTALDHEKRTCLASMYEGRVMPDEPWSSFNYSRNRANRVLSDIKPDSQACRPVQDTLLFD